LLFSFYGRDNRYLLEDVLTRKHSYKDSSEPSRQSFSPSQSLVNNRALLMCNKNIIIFHISDINLQQRDVGAGSVGEWVAQSGKVESSSRKIALQMHFTENLKHLF